VDDQRDAQRKFANRKQGDHETLAEYDQILRTLYKQGWPDAPKAQKDSDLKRQFEEGVTSHDLAQYLKLFTRSLSYAETVQQARRYVTTTEPTRTKKTVRVSTPTSDPSINLFDDGGDRPVINRLKKLEKMVRSLQCVNGNGANRSRSQSPASSVESQGSTRTFGQGFAPRPQSPRPQQSSYQGPRQPRLQARTGDGHRSSEPFRGGNENRPPPLMQPRPQTPPNNSGQQGTPGQNQDPRRQPRPFTGRPLNQQRTQRCFVCGQEGCYAARHRAGPPGRCWVCGTRGCHSTRHEEYEQQGTSQRTQSTDRASTLAADAPLFVPRQNQGQRPSQSPQNNQGNSGRDSGMGARIPAQVSTKSLRTGPTDKLFCQITVCLSNFKWFSVLSVTCCY